MMQIEASQKAGAAKGQHSTKRTTYYSGPRVRRFDTRQGTREILAVEPVDQEAHDTYQALFRDLKQRGLQQVWLCISDAHVGLRQAIQEEFPGCSWQRGKVYFMRNILAEGSPKQIRHQPDAATARRYAESLIDDYADAFPEAMALLEEGLENSLQYYAFEPFDGRRVRSTNVLERLHREIRRRSRVASPFPNMNSYLRLITWYLIEYTEDWSTERSSVSPEKIAQQAEQLQQAT